MENLEEFIFYGKIFDEKELNLISNKAQSLKLKRRTDSLDKKDIFEQKGNRNISFEVILEEYDYNIILEKYMLNLPQKYQNYFCELLKKKYYVDEKITKYDLHDSYDWHIDFNIGKKATRCLSAITYLNDDYCGGETEFFNKIIKPKRGNTLIFPSFWLFPHKGSLVTSGIKYIYVCHFSFSPLNVYEYVTDLSIKYK
jgi:hypothetical protein